MAKKVNPEEAPEGFYAVPKDYSLKHVCEPCDARKLCEENEDFWCYRNMCMSYKIIAKGGKVIGRQDGVSVVFKRRVNESR